jgi:exodeoxyribonuclease III
MSVQRILSWNVNGIRSALKKGFLEFLEKQSPDVICIQETKARPEQLSEELLSPPGYHTFWNYPEKKGYAGVCFFTREKPAEVLYEFSDKGLDSEGRFIAADYGHFILMNIYFPNGGAGNKRVPYKMDFYDKFLEYTDSLVETGRKLVICGDLNTAHKEIDLARPKENVKNTGFLPEERAWMDKFVEHGFVDTFRHFHEEAEQYTYWDMKTGARARNVGWRIDYFFVSSNLLPAVTDSFIMPDVTGSDHCPIGILLELDR